MNLTSIASFSVLENRIDVYRKGYATSTLTGEDCRLNLLFMKDPTAHDTAPPLTITPDNPKFHSS
jgi:hypothetical protein